MQDLFIVIPGIMGSVLCRGDERVWDPGFGMAAKLLRYQKWVEGLTLNDADDPADTGSLDGLTPTTLVSSKTIVPGLVSFDGYDELHDSLEATFGDSLVEGSALHPAVRLDGRDPDVHGVANYYRFAYDWRRDNRANALRLSDLIDVALGRLRHQQRSDKARVVFLAHSMGGLIARYYMYGVNPRTNEPFEGWRNVRELFSMGTPYRGSPDALTHLHSGFRKLFVDFTEALRSYTSVYQLLPYYPMVLRSGLTAPSGNKKDYLRPYELENIEGFDRQRALAAYENFHQPVDTYIEGLGSFHRLGLVPNVGFGHATMSSAQIVGTDLEVDTALPGYLDASLGGGDGTVPLISAIPVEFGDQGASLRYTNQQHGSLQTDRRTLAEEIANRLAHMQAGTLAARDRPAAAPGVLPSLNLDAPRHALADGAESVTASLNDVAADAASDNRIKMVITGLSPSEPYAATHDIEAGASIPLPTVPGDYRIDASSGDLVSQSLVAILEP